MAEATWSIGLVRTGGAWEPSWGLGEQQLIGEHLTYLGRLMAAGEVTQAGPVIGLEQGPDPDGLVGLILYAVGPDRAQDLVTSDPAVRNGMVAVDVRPWHPLN